MSRRSVCSVHLGQCGVQIGKSIWELFNYEHDINTDGTCEFPDAVVNNARYDSFRTFYYETASGRYVPKALFIDSEPSVMDELRTGNLAKLMHQNFMINGQQDCRNVFGLAWHPTFLGHSFHKNIKNQLRKLREQCDSISGVLYFHSTCGGTGSGMTCKVLEHNNSMSRKSVNYSVCLTPSPKISMNPLETQNTIAYMGLTRFDALNMNLIITHDNEALYRHCSWIYGSDYVCNYKDLNQKIALSLSSMTASLRYDGQLNVDLNEFQTNLVPIPTLNYCFASSTKSNEAQDQMSTREITFSAFDPEAYTLSVDPFSFPNIFAEEEGDYFKEIPWIQESEANATEMESLSKLVPKNQHTIYHKFLASCVVYRGDCMPAAINRAMQALVYERSPRFAQWVPSGFKVGINSPPLRSPSTWKSQDMTKSVACFHNNTVVIEKLKQTVHNYKALTEIGGYDSWVTMGGVEPSTLEGCKNGIIDQISQYEYCMATELPMQEIRDQLAGRPEPLGKY